MHTEQCDWDEEELGEARRRLAAQCQCDNQKNVNDSIKIGIEGILHLAGSFCVLGVEMVLEVGYVVRK